MQKFTELKVWQRAHALVLHVYRFSAYFPSDEKYGITSQLRRAAASVPTNIAEGCKRKYPQEYARFLNIAEASLSETQYLLMLARDLNLLSQEDQQALDEQIEHLAPMLFTLREKVEQSVSFPLKPSTVDRQPSTESNHG